eukprot:TRINITY_DN2863_c0_g1_i4.p1 TRINITY_DN2863_c0_g1~~TRINITY_DN2863_c0_g1_i4.p1  ORF type:complete len:206 (+),score=19.15 TRINITY_DN2863_c0_g1_i4:45-620(+)
MSSSSSREMVPQATDSSESSLREEIARRRRSIDRAEKDLDATTDETRKDIIRRSLTALYENQASLNRRLTNRLRRQQLSNQSNSAPTSAESANSSQSKSVISQCEESQPAASEIFQPKSALSECAEPQSTASDSTHSEEDMRMHSRFTNRNGKSDSADSSNATRNSIFHLHALRSCVPCLNSSGYQKLKSE